MFLVDICKVWKTFSGLVKVLRNQQGCWLVIFCYQGATIIHFLLLQLCFSILRSEEKSHAFLKGAGRVYENCQTQTVPTYFEEFYSLWTNWFESVCKRTLLSFHFLNLLSNVWLIQTIFNFTWLYRYANVNFIRRRANESTHVNTFPA